MPQYGTGTGAPSSDFNYELTSTDTAIATRSQVRLLAGDSVQHRGPRPDDRNFSDTEIDYFLSQEEGHIQRAAALALETLASEWSKEQSRQQLGPASSEARQASAFAEQAAALRKVYGFSNPLQAQGIPRPQTSAFVDWTEFYEKGGF